MTGETDVIDGRNARQLEPILNSASVNVGMRRKSGAGATASDVIGEMLCDWTDDNSVHLTHAARIERPSGFGAGDNWSQEPSVFSVGSAHSMVFPADFARFLESYDAEATSLAVTSRSGQ